ncbi:MAG TPA: DUF3108 domain-containing protein [Gemmatimonadales bacterium]|jgi:hypothetical protein|nr:DUF3108 domain-containing protein [Gemmatimonadales bacterium]
MLVTLFLLARAALLPPGPPSFASPSRADTVPATYPFRVGETLRYSASLGYVPIGRATLAVTGLTRERGAEVFVLSMNGQGGPPGLGMSYAATSWVRTQPFTSRRFHRRVTQAGQVTEQRFEIVADSARYREEGGRQDWATPRNALDELAFLYFLRTTPLEVGRSYVWARYFRTGFNPVAVRVTGRETLRLPNGESAPCLVLHVTTKAGPSELWLTDDARRLPAQARVPFDWGEVTLRLTEVASGGGARS